jgi:hypothetical protein
MKRSSLSRKTPMARRKKSKDWSEAIAKKEAEQACRVCKRSYGELVYAGFTLEAAHTVSQSLQDAPGDDGKLRVGAASIIPLCGPVNASRSCHAKHHEHRIDLMPYLTREEEVDAVGAVGLARAYKLLGGER